MLIITDWIDKKLDFVATAPGYDYYIGNPELVKDENLFYITNVTRGVELVLSASLVITSIHIFGNKHNHITPFDGPFPLRIDFTFSRDKVHATLGLPYKAAGGHHDIHLGFINVWDKYLFNEHSIRYEYGGDLNSISLITIGSLTIESQFNSTFG